MHRIGLILSLILALTCPLAAAARGIEVTPTIGFRVAIDFGEVTGSATRLEESPTYGLVLDFPWGERNYLELIVSRQETDLVKTEVFGDPALFPVDVDYIQIGAMRDWGRRRRVRPFFSATLGIVELNPQGTGFRAGRLNTVTRFAGSLGGGARFFFADHVGLRLDGRVFGAYFAGDKELFCGTAGCFARVSGTLFWQAEISTGLILRF